MRVVLTTRGKVFPWHIRYLLSFFPVDRGREVPEELQGKQYDFIVCSDVLYDSASHSCLLKAMREFWGEKTVLMIAYKRRWAVPEKSFFEELESVLGVKLSVFAERYGHKRHSKEQHDFIKRVYVVQTRVSSCFWRPAH